MTLTKLLQDATETPVTSRVGSRPKTIIHQPDYNVEQGRSRELHHYLFKPTYLCRTAYTNGCHVINAIS